MSQKANRRAETTRRETRSSSRLLRPRDKHRSSTPGGFRGLSGTGVRGQRAPCRHPAAARLPPGRCSAG